jgi:hypothetical protein
VKKTKTQKPKVWVDETWKLGKLKPNPRNVNLHSDEQIGEIAASIKRYGFTRPILASRAGLIIAGHGAFAASKFLGLKEVPVRVADGHTETELREYMLADNKLARKSKNDATMLAIELTELHVLGVLEFTGFNLMEFESLTLKPGEKSTDKRDGQFVPEAWDVLVSCNGEQSQRELLDELTKREYKCRALVR